MRNAERWIVSSIDSLLAQTHSNLEVIVVDNASEDRSLEAASCINDRRVIVVSNPTGGLASTLNVGYTRVSDDAQLIARQDADDLSEPGRIEAQVRLLRSDSRLALVGAAHREIDLDGQPLSVASVLTKPDAIRARLRRGNPFAGASILMERWLFDSLGGYDTAFDGRVGEDYDFLVRAAELVDLSAVSDPQYVYRTNNPDSMCGAIGYDYRKAKALVRERANLRQSSVFAEAATT